MRKSILTTLTIFAAAVLSLANAQTLDEVLEKHFKATGQKQLDNVKTVTYEAKMTNTRDEEPTNLSVQMKNPGKFYYEFHMQGKTLIQAFDGEKGWMINPWIGTEPQDLEGDLLSQAQTQSLLEDPLWNYKEKGHKAELIGKVKEGDNAYFQLKLTPKLGPVMNYFLDPDTYLTAKVKLRIDAMGVSMDSERNMLDYVDFDGIKVATKIETFTTNAGSDAQTVKGVIFIEDLKFNTDIDDAVFARPGM